MWREWVSTFKWIWNMDISISRLHFTLLCFNIVSRSSVCSIHTLHCWHLTKTRKTSVEQWRCCAGLRMNCGESRKFRWNRPRVRQRKKWRCLSLLFSPSGVVHSKYCWVIGNLHILCYVFVTANHALEAAPSPDLWIWSSQ